MLSTLIWLPIIGAAIIGFFLATSLQTVRDLELLRFLEPFSL